MVVDIISFNDEEVKNKIIYFLDYVQTILIIHLTQNNILNCHDLQVVE